MTESGVGELEVAGKASSRDVEKFGKGLKKAKFKDASFDYVTRVANTLDHLIS